MTYDPVPDLAALIDGTYETARSGGDPAVLGRLLTGPYARLRGGLLLDKPGRERTGTEQALREALTWLRHATPVADRYPDGLEGLSGEQAALLVQLREADAAGYRKEESTTRTGDST